MLHSSVKSTWNDPIHQLVHQYRLLADWIEEYSVVPWYVDINWANDTLLIHLREETFFRLFQGKQAVRSSDPQGVTWTIQWLDLTFICFIPQLHTTEEQISPAPNTNKESA